MMHAECMTMKLTGVKGKGDSYLRMNQGISWKPHEEVVFDDHTVMVFDDKDNSANGSLTTPDDLNMKLSKASPSIKLEPLEKQVER